MCVFSCIYNILHLCVSACGSECFEKEESSIVLCPVVCMFVCVHDSCMRLHVKVCVGTIPQLARRPSWLVLGSSWYRVCVCLCVCVSVLAMHTCDSQCPCVCVCVCVDLLSVGLGSPHLITRGVDAGPWKRPSDRNGIREAQRVQAQALSIMRSIHFHFIRSLSFSPLINVPNELKWKIKFSLLFK